MQCHVEMTPELIASWCDNGAAEIAASDSPGVQQPAAIQADVDARTARLHHLADKIYSRWIQGLSIKTWGVDKCLLRQDSAGDSRLKAPSDNGLAQNVDYANPI
jgi:hypothetical protein